MSLCKMLFVVILLIASQGVVAARENVDLNSDWKFLREDPAKAQAEDFDDTNWQAVNLPHTWNAADANGGQNDYYRGPGWYRRHLQISQEQLSQRIVLRFGACGSKAEVFVNGKTAGKHAGAFGAFSFDVTELIHSGDNLIAVRGDNTYDQMLPPIRGDFNIQGGLYRDAQMIVMNPLSISPLDFASDGIYIAQKNVTDDAATLEITTHLRNTTAAQSASVQSELVDAAGKSICGVRTDGQVKAESTATTRQQMTFGNPHLWNGKSDPYLYSLVATVLDGSGKETDRVTIPIGLRYFKVDGQRGFFLNGKPYDLHGVARHQDFAGVGWAITPRHMQIDMDLIKEMGCTFVRGSHYEQSPKWYDLCDREGLVMWAELGLVNRTDPAEAFTDSAKQQLTELIKQNLNHPSICFWSIFNELDLKDPNDIELAKKLNPVAKELDSTRPTTAAMYRQIENPANWITDIIGANRYYGWYTKTALDAAPEIDKILNYANGRPVGISEYGAGANPGQHEANPKQPPPMGTWHPEEYQATMHEINWAAMRDRPALWCKTIWVFADFASAIRHEGETIGINDKGLVSHDRKLKKDAFYFYKANWSDDPFVYITGRRFSPRGGDGNSAVKIYSNCDEVELKIGERSFGVRKSVDHIFRWNVVPLAAGENQISAIGLRDGKSFSDMCVIVYDSNLPATTQPATAPSGGK